MTILDVKRDPHSGHYDLRLRLTEAEALDLGARIMACESDRRHEPPAPPASTEGEPTP